MILNIYMFIYFAIINYINSWCDGQIVKTFDCGQRGQGSNPTLDISSWWTPFTKPTKKTYFQQYNYP